MFGENIKLAFHSLGANKLRTFLTMLGIMIGIASVVAIYTLGTSQTKTYEEQMAANGVNNINILMYSDDYEEHSNDVYMTEDLMNQFLNEFGERLQSIGVYCYGGSGKQFYEESKIEDNYSAGELAGVNRGYLQTQHKTLLVGRNFTEAEELNGAAVCIITEQAVKYLFDGDNAAAVGSTIHFRKDDSDDVDLRVIGVLRYSMAGGRGASRGQDIYSEVWVPFSYVVNNMAGSNQDTISHISYFSVQAKVGEDVIALTEEMQKWFEKDRFPSEYKAGFELWNNKESIESSRASMQAQVRTTAMIAAIALLVGGIGVMNIMTVTITERTREIGTRKALGAKSKAIRQQFIIEAAVMSLIGGTIGMIAGFIGGVVGCNMMNYTLAIPWEAIFGSFAISLFVGIFFGYYPADKAAKLDPIEALRYE